jgi:omega-6 fatty acid desaturase (delta-12 desaturase)
LPFDTPRAWRRERRAVHLTNLGVVAIVLTLGLSLGFGAMAAVQLPVMVVASIVGVWLFSVQHRFERTRWDRDADWRYETAALAGSSYLRLPGVLRWFTGNIGFHHVHHAHPGIPNYRLRACHEATPALHVAPVLSLWQGLTAWRYALWHEAEGRMVPFAAARRRTP